MRRFLVYLDKQVPGLDPSREVVEVPDNASDEEVDEACRDVLDTMIGNELDTGWVELGAVVEGGPRT